MVDARVTCWYPVVAVVVLQAPVPGRIPTRLFCLEAKVPVIRILLPCNRMTFDARWCIGAEAMLNLEIPCDALSEDLRVECVLPAALDCGSIGVAEATGLGIT